MIYIYYNVTSIDDYKDKLSGYFEEGKRFGLEKLMQRGGQPDLFMEVVAVGSNIGEPLKGLSFEFPHHHS